MSIGFGNSGSFSIGSDGTLLDLESWAHTYTYNSDGTLATESVINGGTTWTKTYTYTSGNLTAESIWVKQ